MATPPTDLTTAYETALAASAGRATLQVTRSMRGLSSRDMASAWPEIATAITAAVTLSQRAAQDLSHWYLEASLATVAGTVATLPPSSGIVGTTVTGMSVARYVARTPEVVTVRTANGMKAEEALAMSERTLTSLAASEPHRVARGVIAAVTTESPLYVGWQRVPEANACSFCRLLASRGGAYTSRASASQTSKALRYHRNCRCTAVPVPKTNAAAINAQAASNFNGQTARISGNATGAAAQRAEFARTAPLYRPGALTPERLSSINLEISQVEQRLVQMSAGDTATASVWSRPRKWNTQRLADLKAERAAFN